MNETDPFHVPQRAFWIGAIANIIGIAVNASLIVYDLWWQNLAGAGFETIPLGLCAIFLFVTVILDRRLTARLANAKLKHDKLLLDNESAKAFVGFAEAQKALAEHMLWLSSDNRSAKH